VNPILKALPNGEDVLTVADAEKLRLEVERKGFCYKSGRPLTVETAVLVTLHKGRVLGHQVMLGEVYDLLKDSFDRTAKQTEATLTVIDGRTEGAR
jgi:hypothetical protein